MSEVELDAPVTGIQTQALMDEAKTVKRHFLEARTDKERFSKKWAFYWKLFLGKHWPEMMQNDFERSRPVIQKVHQAVNTRLAHLTSRRPLVTMTSEKLPSTELWTRVFDAVWLIADVDHLRSLCVLNDQVVGVGCLKVLFDPAARDGKGEIDVQVIDPHNIFVAPGAINERDADYIIHAQNITMGQLHRMYHGDEEVKARIALVKKGPDEPGLTFDVLAEEKGNSGMMQGFGTDGTTSNGTVFRGPADGKNESSQDERISVFEEWSRRDDGKYHVRVVANDVLLDSYPSDYHDKMDPFVFYKTAPTTISFWSQGTVSVIDGLQMLINKLYSQVLDILRLTANPILLIPIESGIQADSIKCKPGLVLPYNAGEGSRPSWLAPGSPPGEIFASIQYFTRTIDEILGNQEVMQGQAPPGVEAAKAIEALASQASIRIEREAAWLQKGDEKLARLLVSRIGQYYTDDRTITSKGEDGAVSYINLNEQKTQDDGTSSILNEITESDIQVQVEIGPSLPAVRLAEFQKTMLLAQAGAFGPPLLPTGMVNPIWQRELLKNANYKNYKQIQSEVAQMMTEARDEMIKMQAAAQAQAQAQGQAPPTQTTGATQ